MTNQILPQEGLRLGAEGKLEAQVVQSTLFGASIQGLCALNHVL